MVNLNCTIKMMIIGEKILDQHIHNHIESYTFFNVLFVLYCSMNGKLRKRKLETMKHTLHTPSSNTYINSILQEECSSNLYMNHRATDD